MRSFVRWYDSIYAHKNYQQDIQTVLYFTQQFSSSFGADFLEIGAGTGNHTMALSNAVRNLWVVEKDTEMAALGQQKTAHLSHVRWHVGALETVPWKFSVDAAVALFNVVNYFLDEQGFIQFLSHLYEHLKIGGIFIFDCWNGNLSHTSGKREEIRKVAVDNLRIEKTITTQIDQNKKFAELNYHIKIINETQEEEFFERLPIRIWNVEELIEAGEKASFKIKAIRPHQQPELPTHLSATNLWIVFKKE